VLAAFALPSEFDSEVRRRQIRRTLERASLVPTEIAEAACEIATEAVELAERGNPNLRGDASIAATLAAAAARAAAELVRLNVELGELGGDLADRAAHAAEDAAKAVAVLNSRSCPYRWQGGHKGLHVGAPVAVWSVARVVGAVVSAASSSDRG
jgi:formiminotetrahydrofolate cyclodeaminase